MNSTKVKEWWSGLPRRTLMIGGGVVLLLLISAIVVAALAWNIDLTVPGNVVEYHGAVFIQIDSPESSAGTGNYDPFLQIKQSNSPIVMGYNTDAEPQYQEVDGWTHAVLMSDLPMVDYEGAFYREFYLDINQANPSTISLDEIKIFAIQDPLGYMVTDYITATETFDGWSAVKLWDLDEGLSGDATIYMDYSIGAGSGYEDARIMVAESFFDGYPQCNYGSENCDTWVTVWNLFGLELENNDGFEEWGTVARPTVAGSKWHDENANGIWDESPEAGLEGWEIQAFADGDGDGILSEAEYLAGPVGTQTTDAYGGYAFAFFDAGDYIFCEVLQTDWLQSFPANSICAAGAPELSGGGWAVYVGFGDNLTDYDFGNYMPTPDITIDKTGDTLSKVGDDVDYTITVENTSGPGTPDLYCNITDAMLEIDEYIILSKDASLEINKTYTVPSGAPDPLVNTASVSCTYVGDETEQAWDSDDHSVNLFQPAIELTKVGDELSKIGDLVDYTITLENNSSGDTPDLECTITDEELGIAEPVTLASGASHVINVTDWEVPADAADPYVNTASVLCSPVGFPNEYPDSATWETNLFQPAIELTKVGDELSKIGDLVDYTITLENNSSGDTPDLECTITDEELGIAEPVTLASGASHVINVTDWEVPADAADPYVNTASVLCSPVGFPNEYDDDASWSTNLFQPAIELTKVGDELSKIGDLVDYTITLENNSSGDTPDLECTITDEELGIAEPVTLASGASHVINVTDWEVPADAADPYVNTASVLCSPVGFPNEYPDSATWETNLFQPAIELTKVGDELSKIGDLVDYTITLENNSSGDTPDLECTITDEELGIAEPVTLASGASHVINVTDWEVPADAADPYVNTASVLCSPVGFPNEYDDDASWSTNLFQPAIELTKVGDELSKIGDLVDYTITLENNSSGDTPDLECTITDEELGIAEPVTLASGASHVINVTDWEVPADAADPYVNTASVLCSPVGFPNEYDDDASWSTNLFQPSFTFDKSVAEVYSKAGDVVHYTITLDNTSSDDSPALVCTITDVMLSIDEQVTLAWDDPNYVMNPTYTVQEGDPDPLVNTASVECSPIGFPNVLPDSEGASVDLLHPDFTLSKECVEEPVVAGEDATFEVIFANTGDVDLVVEFDEELVCTGYADPIPAYTQVTVAEGASLNCTVTKAADTDPLESYVENTVNAHVTLPEWTGLDNYWDPTASDECDIYAIKAGVKTDTWLGVPLSGWIIELWDVTDTPVFVGSDSTDGTGAYLFDQVVPGRTYAVCEVLMLSYVQTYPDANTPDPPDELIFDCTVLGINYGPYGYQFTPESGEAYLDNDFSNEEAMGCTLTQGYWKTHSVYGPAGPADDGWYTVWGPWAPGALGPDAPLFQSGLTWLEAFNTPPAGGNAWFILAHQWMAAYLNYYNFAGSGGTDVVQWLSDGAALLDTYDGDGTSDSWIPEGAVREEAILLADWLDQYNNGLIGPGSCEE